MLALSTNSALAVISEGAASVTGFSAVWEQVLGRMHPVFVHLPLGLFVGAGIFALIGGRRGRLNGTVRACLTLGVLVAVAAAASGWLFAFHEAGDDPALDRHRWAGVATLGLGLVVLLIGVRVNAESGRGRAFRWGALLLALLTIFTGHEGGEQVWGSGYAFEPLGQAERQVESANADPAELSEPVVVDFKTQVAPIFEAHCYTCHGPKKARGRLRLDEREYVFSGENQVILPGNSKGSELFRRVSLPPGDDDVMPAKGERLNAEQISLLQRWINEGAAWPD